MWSIVVLLINGFGPTDLTENSKLILLELNRISVMWHVAWYSIGLNLRTSADYYLHKLSSPM